eukprot:3391015-Pleurochrysis_carterae.AAC.2
MAAMKSGSSASPLNLTRASGNTADTHAGTGEAMGVCVCVTLAWPACARAQGQPMALMMIATLLAL